MSLHKKTSKSGGDQKSPDDLEDRSGRSAKKSSAKSGGCLGLLRRWLIRLVILGMVLVIVIPFGIYITQPKYFKIA